MSGPELKSCPFCGGEASDAGIVRYTDQYAKEQGYSQTEFYYCNCTRCGANNMGLVGFKASAEAIEAWNRRALTAAPQPAPAVGECWQDISTAPKDGTKILAYCFGNNLPYISVIWWRGDKYPASEFQWRSAANDSAVGGYGQCHLPSSQRTWKQGPTHWMQLPVPPSTPEGA